MARTAERLAVLGRSSVQWETERFGTIWANPPKRGNAYMAGGHSFRSRPFSSRHPAIFLSVCEGAEKWDHWVLFGGFGTCLKMCFQPQKGLYSVSHVKSKTKKTMVNWRTCLRRALCNVYGHVASSSSHGKPPA